MNNKNSIRNKTREKIVKKYISFLSILNFELSTKKPIIETDNIQNPIAYLGIGP